jgi:hypothetical protein
MAKAESPPQVEEILKRIRGLSEAEKQELFARLQRDEELLDEILDMYELSLSKKDHKRPLSEFLAELGPPVP